MSRLAKKPIVIPLGVFVERQGNLLILKGPKGEIQKNIPLYIDVEKRENGITVSLKNASKENYVVLGTTAALIRNWIMGVKDGFEKRLEIEGIGYKAQLENGVLVLSLGFTHPVRIKPPTDITFKVEKNSIIVSGLDKEEVGRVAAEIRAKKEPEPYKGKGIRYTGEVTRRKAGKKAVAAA